MSTPDRPAALAAELRAAGCVFAEDEAALLLASTDDPAQLAGLTARRVAGEPLEQVLGWASFRGLRIAVVPGVFVPRRRSELLVREGLRLLSRRPADAEPAVVLELCCGVAAVAAALVVDRPDAVFHVADIDPVAVACASRNLPPRTPTYCGDLFDPLPDRLRGRLDLVVANAPYVPTDEIALMPAEARLHEPATALDGGADGVAVHRRIAAEVGGWLAPGGSVLIETSVRQAALTAAALTAAGLITRTVRSEPLDATVVAARRRVRRRAA